MVLSFCQVKGANFSSYGFVVSGDRFLGGVMYLGTPFQW